MSLVDNLIALRVLHLLVSPFKKWPAFKSGVIDDEGNQLTKKLTGTQKSDWTMLHRLVWRLKLIIAKIPGGQSQLASIAAAYLLVKESVNSHSDVLNIHESLRKKISLVTDRDIAIIEDAMAVANTTGAVMAQTRDIPSILSKKKLIRRQKVIKYGNGQ